MSINGYIYSKLSNNSSLVPLAVKDVANSCGLTAASYIAGDTVEGKDRFIDEFGTQAIWLWGIPAYKTILDYTLFKAAKLDPEVDARILKNPEILKLAQEFAPNAKIKKSLENVAKHQIKFKNLTMIRFAASTVLTAGTYLGLTKFRHNYTENQIKKDYFERQKTNLEKAAKQGANIPFSSAFADIHKNKLNNNGKSNQSSNNSNNKNVAFTGRIQDFIFDPVKNLMLVDGTITGERLTHARNPQDFMGYVIKEGLFWTFMYFAGPLISKAMEAHADKKGKSIDLDARVIESTGLENVMQNGTLKSQLEEFKNISKNDAELYKFAVQPDNKNFVIYAAKKSDVINCLKKTKTPDTRKYIDLDELRNVGKKLEKLLTQYENSGETLNEFLGGVRKLKKHAVLKNIGACIGALGILAPALMLITRKDNEYQVKADIEKKLAQKQNQPDIDKKS